MDALETKRPSSNGPSSRASNFTVILVGSYGKIRRFKISRRILLFSSLFFVFYTLTSIFLINGYFEERRRNAGSSKELGRLKQELTKSKGSLYRLEQHLAFLEDYISTLEKEQEETTPPPLYEAGDMDHESDDLEAAAEGTHDQEKKEVALDVRDLKVRRGESKLTFDFKVVNLRQEEGGVSGYVHTIATVDSSGPPQYWTYPKVALRDGFPVRYELGQLFTIRRFMTIRGEYQLETPSPSPSSIRVLVYSRTGDLIFQREFEVEDIPES